MSKEVISQTEGLCKEVTICIRNAYERGYKQGFNDCYSTFTHKGLEQTTILDKYKAVKE